MCNIGMFRGVRRLDGKNFEAVKFPIRCNQWSCPDCKIHKIKTLYARVLNGHIAQDAQLAGYQSKYAIKLLTLTVPGTDYRNKHSTRDAYEEMTRGFDKLIRALKKKWGDFHYLRVVELQKDGYPHYHVMLVGKNIAPKGVLDHIRSLWCKIYHLGNVDLQVKKSSQCIQKAIKYLLKYVTKDGQFDTSFKGIRIFSASRKALEPTRHNTSQWIATSMRFGRASTTEEENMSWQFAFDNALPVPHGFEDIWHLLWRSTLANSKECMEIL